MPRLNAPSCPTAAGGGPRALPSAHLGRRKRATVGRAQVFHSCHIVELVAISLEDSNAVATGDEAAVTGNCALIPADPAHSNATTDAAVRSRYPKRCQTGSLRP